MIKNVGIALIIENESAVARVLELKLKQEGIACEVAADGEEALKKLKKEKYDPILLDLILPKVDGFKVLEGITRLKKNKTLDSDVRVIVFSYLNQEKDIKKAVDLGAEKVFMKGKAKIGEIIDYIANN